MTVKRWALPVLRAWWGAQRVSACMLVGWARSQGEIGEQVAPFRWITGVPDQEQRLNCLRDWQCLMEQQYTGAMLPTSQEVGEVIGHRVVVVAHQHTLRVRSARQDLWIRDTGKRRRICCLEIDEWLAA
jgi:hypothetical protein